MELLFNAEDPETGFPLSEAEIVAELISYIVGQQHHEFYNDSRGRFRLAITRSPRAVCRRVRQCVSWTHALGLGRRFSGRQPIAVLNAVVGETMRWNQTIPTGFESVPPIGGR